MRICDRPNLAVLALVLSLATLASRPALSHGDSNEGHQKKMDYSKAEVHPFGKAADPMLATRTVVVEMSDDMRFTPDVVEVERGEVVRFEIKNMGRMRHEMVLGTSQEIDKHAAMMKKFPGMEHDEPYMAHVAPRKLETMGWQFTNAGEYDFACLIPGHFEGGMKGKILVR